MVLLLGVLLSVATSCCVISFFCPVLIGFVFVGLEVEASLADDEACSSRECVADLVVTRLQSDGCVAFDPCPVVAEPVACCFLSDFLNGVLYRWCSIWGFRSFRPWACCWATAGSALSGRVRPGVSVPSDSFGGEAAENREASKWRQWCSE